MEGNREQRRAVGTRKQRAWRVTGYDRFTGPQNGALLLVFVSYWAGMHFSWCVTTEKRCRFDLAICRGFGD